LNCSDGVGVSGIVSEAAAAVTAESADTAVQGCIGVNDCGPRVSVVLNPFAPPFQSS